MSPSGEKQSRVTLNGGFEPLEGSGGAEIYYTNLGRMWRKDLISGEETKVSELQDVAMGRSWDLVDDAIYFAISTHGINYRINRLDLRSRLISPVTVLEGYLPKEIPNLSVSRTGMIAYSYAGSQSGELVFVKDWE